MSLVMPPKKEENNSDKLDSLVPSIFEDNCLYKIACKGVGVNLAPY